MKSKKLLLTLLILPCLTGCGLSKAGTFGKSVLNYKFIEKFQPKTVQIQEASVTKGVRNYSAINSSVSAAYLYNDSGKVDVYSLLTNQLLAADVTLYDVTFEALNDSGFGLIGYHTLTECKFLDSLGRVVYECPSDKLEIAQDEGIYPSILSIQSAKNIYGSDDVIITIAEYLGEDAPAGISRIYYSFANGAHQATTEEITIANSYDRTYVRGYEDKGYYYIVNDYDVLAYKNNKLLGTFNFESYLTGNAHFFSHYLIAQYYNAVGIEGDKVENYLITVDGVKMQVSTVVFDLLTGKTEYVDFPYVIDDFTHTFEDNGKVVAGLVSLREIKDKNSSVMTLKTYIIDDKLVLHDEITTINPIYCQTINNYVLNKNSNVVLDKKLNPVFTLPYSNYSYFVKGNSIIGTSYSNIEIFTPEGKTVTPSNNTVLLGDSNNTEIVYDYITDKTYEVNLLNYQLTEITNSVISGALYYTKNSNNLYDAKYDGKVIEQNVVSSDATFASKGAALYYIDSTHIATYMFNCFTYEGVNTWVTQKVTYGY